MKTHEETITVAVIAIVIVSIYLIIAGSSPSTEKQELPRPSTQVEPLTTPTHLSRVQCPCCGRIIWEHQSYVCRVCGRKVCGWCIGGHKMICPTCAKKKWVNDR